MQRRIRCRFESVDREVTGVLGSKQVVASLLRSRYVFAWVSRVLTNLHKRALLVKNGIFGLDNTRKTISATERARYFYSFLQ